MVYGIVRLINFAHGDIIMLAAYFVFFGVGIFSLPWWLAVIISIGLTVLTGITIEKAAYKPLREAPRISILISAIGVHFFLENVGLVVFGGRAKPFYTPDLFKGVIKIAGVSITNLSIIIPVISAILLIGMVNIVNHTKTGMAMRACSKDMDTAELMGIDVDKIILHFWDRLSFSGSRRNHVGFKISSDSPTHRHYARS